MDEPIVAHLPIDVASELVARGDAREADADVLPTRGLGDYAGPALVVLNTAGSLVTLTAEGRTAVAIVIDAVRRWVGRVGPQANRCLIEARGPGGTVRFDLTDAPDPEALAAALSQALRQPAPSTSPAQPMKGPSSSSDMGPV
jgi:hypothetical protein